MKAFDTYLIGTEIIEIEMSWRHCEGIKSVTPKWTWETHIYRWPFWWKKTKSLPPTPPSFCFLFRSPKAPSDYLARRGGRHRRHPHPILAKDLLRQWTGGCRDQKGTLKLQSVQAWSEIELVELSVRSIPLGLTSFEREPKGHCIISHNWTALQWPRVTSSLSLGYC